MCLVRTKTEREALKALWRLSSGGDVHTGELAEAMGVHPATATALVKKLAGDGLVIHRPYRGVELTNSGRRAAIGAIRRHRIVERFLSDLLGYSWYEADRLAVTFEHELPEEVEERLFVALGRPVSCPHGFPIPAADDAELPELPPLYALEPGDSAVVALPGSIDPEVVAFLDNMGLRPGVTVEVRAKQPFDGPVVVSVGGEDRTLGEWLARQVFVRKDVVELPKEGLLAEEEDMSSQERHRGVPEEQAI
jgi:DtxR family Mn-dependent transcriptional regulator